MHRQNKTQGFTIIELLFAMSFVSVLLIIVLTATLQITRIYNKGITLKQVNQSGAAIGSELQMSLKAADAPLSTTAVKNGDNTGGRLCLGTYSYVWNLKGATTNKYNGNSDKIGLVKVSDPSRAMCDGTPGVPKAKATELILGSQDTAGVHLELRDFSIEQVANSGINYVYTITYTVSTDDHSLISADTEACSGSSSDEFCALNRFSFEVFARQGGSGKV